VAARLTGCTHAAPTVVSLDCCARAELALRSVCARLLFLQLGTSLVELTKLDMSHMTGISFQGVRGFPSLRRLDLSRCDQLIPGALATALEGFE
jgi:hypothetical protein